MIWGVIFLLLCMVLNLAHVKVFDLVIALGVYAEVIGSFGVALLLFLFLRERDGSQVLFLLAEQRRGWSR